MDTKSAIANKILLGSLIGSGWLMTNIALLRSLGAI